MNPSVSLAYLMVEIVLAIVTAPWLPPLVGIYAVVAAGVVWICREWRL